MNSRLVARCVLAACMLPAAASIVHGQDPNAGKIVAEGWRTIERGEFEAATYLFYAVIKRYPEHADAHAGLGAAYARRGKYDLALNALIQAYKLDSRYEHLGLELGRAHYFQKQYKLALPHLEAYRKSHSAVWQTYEILGLCYFKTRDFGRCIEAFNHETLRKQGKHPAMYLYYTGLATAAQGDRVTANQQINKVLKDYPDSPQGKQLAKKVEAARENIDPWQRARKTRSEDKWWYLIAGSEGRFDTNPVSLGHDVIVPASLSDEGAWVYEGYVGAGARIVNSEDTLVNLEVRYLLNTHDEIPEFDQNVASAGLYAEHWLSDAVGLFATLGGAQLWIDSDATLDQWSAGGGGYYREADWTRTRVAAGFTNAEYFLDTLPAASDIDNRSTAVGVSQEFAIQEAGLQFAVGYNYRNQAANGADYDADFHQASFSGAYDLPWKMRVLGSLAYTSGDYDNDNSRDPDRDPRNDDVWTGSLRLQRPVTDWATVYVGARFIDHESNVGFADYDRTQWTFGFDLKY